ncbi:MAG: methyltransferase domain-containing protein [bacterium]|nr:methyltransferase domain-containing protein [bacterium]
MFIKIAQKISKGQSILRVMMNYGLVRYSIRGKVVDIGGGRSPDYFLYMRIEPGTDIVPIDGSLNGIDFETDNLPENAHDADVILCMNVLEHVYNYNFLVSEMRRILKPGGQLIGFVPFFINYHPDPHDYFRYTKEALRKILEDFHEIEVREVGIGPMCVGLNNIVLYLPSFLKVLLFLPCYFLDKAWLRVRPDITSRYPLGYIFSARKSI